MKSTIEVNNNVPSYLIELSVRLILSWASINYLSTLGPSICQSGRMSNETVTYELQQRQDATDGVQQSLMQFNTLSDGGQYAVYSPCKFGNSVEYTLQQLKTVQIIWHGDWRGVCVTLYNEGQSHGWWSLPSVVGCTSTTMIRDSCLNDVYYKISLSTGFMVESQSRHCWLVSYNTSNKLYKNHIIIYKKGMYYFIY